MEQSNKHKLSRCFKQKIKRFWPTALLALFFLICSYAFSNLDLGFDDDSDILKWIKIGQYELLSKDDAKECPDSILLINTCYDNTFVDVTDSYGIPVGTINITDRNKLNQLLNQIKQFDNYRYIMLDIGLSTLYETAYDDSLYNTISSMRDFVIAQLDTLPIDQRIKDKCFNCSYRVTVFNSDCVKFPLFLDGQESMSYKAFSDITGRKISRIGPFYFEGGHLARKSIYPDYTFVIRKQYYNDSTAFAQEALYYNLGSDILDSRSAEKNRDLFDNKIIVIGDFNDKDFHQTYVGNIAGPLIHLNVLTSLMHDAHQVPYYLLILLYIIFFLVSDSLLHRSNALSYDETMKSFALKSQISKGLIPVALLSTYYTLLLVVLCALIYIITGQAYDIMFTGVLIGVAHWVIRIFKRKSK